MRKFYTMKYLCFLLIAILPMDGLRAQVCSPPLRQGVLDRFYNDTSEPVNLTENIEISARFVDLSRADGSDYFENISFSMGEKVIMAEQALYFQSTGFAEASGSVSYSDRNIFIASEYAEIDTVNESISFIETEFDLSNPFAIGRSGRLTINNAGLLDIENAFFTTCAEEIPFWSINASRLNLNTQQGIGRASNLSLRLKNIPLLYLPSLSFPISNQRKTGFLMPEFGNSQKLGTNISFPFYLNLSENYDLILSPGYISEYGSTLEGQYRHLISSGELDLSWQLINDQISEKNRYVSELNFNFNIENFTLGGNIETFSDQNYYEDFYTSRNMVATPYIKNNIHLSGHFGNWHFNAQAFQNTIINPLDEYASIWPESHQNKDESLIPSLSLIGFKSFGGIFYDHFSELSYFEEYDNILRFDSTHSLSSAINLSGINITPSYLYRLTNYHNEILDINRTAGVASIEINARFRKNLSRSLDQIIEPKLLIVQSDISNQENIPLIDSSLAELSYLSIFNPFRFVGADRVLPRDDLVLGVSTEILQNSTKREILSGTFALASRKPFEDVSNISVDNDYIIEMNSQFTSTFRAQFSRRWNEADATATQTVARIIYNANEQTYFSLGYSQRDQFLNQLTLASVFPILNGSFFSKIAYDFENSESLEKRVGWQYNGCCWGLGIEYYNYISQRSGDQDDGFRIQFFLTGLINNRSNLITNLIGNGVR